jgi:hypothetical protein
MSSTPSGPGSGRYIIRSEDPGELAGFINSISTDPGMELVDLIGPAGQPHTAVVTMPHEKAARLEQSFRTSNKLTIEPDRPLSLFGGA